MIKERLLQAKKLLTDDGVIFVSIDDNEQSYLKILMDEIFGEENFVANISWQSSFGGKNDTKLIPINTEYILCYSQSNNFEKNLKKEVFNFHFSDDNFEHYGNFSIQQLYWSSLQWYENLDYIVYINDIDGILSISFEKTNTTVGKIVAGPGGFSYKEKFELHKKRFLGIHNTNDWCFYWSKETMIEAQKQGFIHIDKKNNEYFIYKKTYERAKFDGREKRIISGDNSKMALRNVINDSKITTSIGTKEIDNIFNKKIFNYPKPIKLIKNLLSVKNKNIIILDFFAGSGTTGHAVMELNQEDDGNRKFILVTNNENNIGKEITWERLNRLITKDKLPSEYKGNTYPSESVRVFEIDEYPCNLKDNIQELENQIKKSFSKIDKNYSQKLDLDILYDLKSLNPLEKNK